MLLFVSSATKDIPSARDLLRLQVWPTSGTHHSCGSLARFYGVFISNERGNAAYVGNVLGPVHTALRRCIARINVKV